MRPVRRGILRRGAAAFFRLFGGAAFVRLSFVLSYSVCIHKRSRRGAAAFCFLHTFGSSILSAAKAARSSRFASAFGFGASWRGVCSVIKVRRHSGAACLLRRVTASACFGVLRLRRPCFVCYAAFKVRRLEVISSTIS